MNTEELQEKWPELKDKLQEKYPTLTREDLILKIGEEEELLKRLQARLNKNRKEIFDVLSVMG